METFDFSLFPGHGRRRIGCELAQNSNEKKNYINFERVCVPYTLVVGKLVLDKRRWHEILPDDDDDSFEGAALG